ncbi:hypothetical protein [Streptomyces geranii]|uniref:hypothetical protein n=1 Tax=Streptomyces geranii TaxID=2058923 RepID=UPI000D040EB0|nr:hypothetical protein [Streptomyces geranii]
MHITFDFGTVVWTVVGILTGFGVYQWTQPTAPTAPTTPPVGMTKGERLVFALTAAVAVITIGGYLSGGVEKIEIDKPVPTATVTAQSSPGARSPHGWPGR